MTVALCYIDKYGYPFYKIDFNIKYDMNTFPEVIIEGSFDLYIDSNTMKQHSKVKPYTWAAQQLQYYPTPFLNFTLRDIKVTKHKVNKKKPHIVTFYYEAKGISLVIGADR